MNGCIATKPKTQLQWRQGRIPATGHWQQTYGLLRLVLEADEAGSSMPMVKKWFQLWQLFGLYDSWRFHMHMSNISNISDEPSSIKLPWAEYPLQMHQWSAPLFSWRRLWPMQKSGPFFDLLCAVCTRRGQVLQGFGAHKESQNQGVMRVSHRLYIYNILIWMFPKIVVPPKSSILIGFSLINHPFWGTPIFGNTHMRTWGNITYS